MVFKTIKTTDDNESFTTYGICGNSGAVPYRYDDISENMSYAEILDTMLSSTHVPEKIIDKLVPAYVDVVSNIVL